MRRHVAHCVEKSRTESHPAELSWMALQDQLRHVYTVLQMEVVLRRGAERVEVNSSLVTTEVLQADLHF